MKHDFFGWFPRKIPGATKHLKRQSGFSRRNSVWVNATQNSGLVNFVPEFLLPCTNLRFIRSMTVIFFADSKRFRVHQAKFEPNTWGRPILMAQSIPSIPFTNPFAAFSFPKQNDKCPTNARQMPGPRLELTEPLDLNTIIPYSLLDLQAPVPGKPIIANPGLNIAWT